MYLNWDLYTSVIFLILISALFTIGGESKPVIFTSHGHLLDTPVFKVEARPWFGQVSPCSGIDFATVPNQGVVETVEVAVAVRSQSQYVYSIAGWLRTAQVWQGPSNSSLLSDFIQTIFMIGGAFYLMVISESWWTTHHKQSLDLPLTNMVFSRFHESWRYWWHRWPIQLRHIFFDCVFQHVMWSTAQRLLWHPQGHWSRLPLARNEFWTDNIGRLVLVLRPVSSIEHQW